MVRKLGVKCKADILFTFESEDSIIVCEEGKEDKRIEAVDG
ncbi:hypothetical protein JNUCC23_02890 [Peribacillus sp. JNUCC 23]